MPSILAWHVIYKPNIMLQPSKPTQESTQCTYLIERQAAAPLITYSHRFETRSHLLGLGLGPQRHAVDRRGVRGKLVQRRGLAARRHGWDGLGWGWLGLLKPMMTTAGSCLTVADQTSRAPATHRKRATGRFGSCRGGVEGAGRVGTVRRRRAIDWNRRGWVRGERASVPWHDGALALSRLWPADEIRAAALPNQLF